MVSLFALWLPIFLAAVFVFVASSLVHMVLQWHNRDYAQLPDEEAVLDALRRASVRPGAYVFPKAQSMKDLGTPEMKARYERGPVGFAQILPSGMPAMGKALGLWFLFCILVGIFVAYIASRGGLPPGAGAGRVFQVTSATAFLAFGMGAITDTIWRGQSSGTTARYLADGLLYAVVTGLAFAWLWP